MPDQSKGIPDDGIARAKEGGAQRHERLGTRGKEAYQQFFDQALVIVAEHDAHRAAGLLRAVPILQVDDCAIQPDAGVRHTVFVLLVCCVAGKVGKPNKKM